MMTYELIRLNEIVVVPAPAFCNLKWEAYCQIIGWEKLHALAELMGSERHTCITPWHYLNRMYAFKLFVNGNSAYDVEVILGLPQTTANRYYREFVVYRKSL